MSKNVMLRCLTLVFLVGGSACLALACGDSDGGEAGCDPAVDECVCADENGQECEDVNDLDCYCEFPDDGFGDNNGNNGAQTQHVEIFDFAYTPATLTLAVGSTVTWTNKDPSQHTVTAEDGSFDQLLNEGESFSFTFNSGMISSNTIFFRIPNDRKLTFDNFAFFL